MARSYVIEVKENEGQKISLSGFVNTRRDHGKIIFFDLRDSSGLVQIVATPKLENAYQVATGLGTEDVVTVTGTVGKRPAENVNPDLPTGEIEVAAEKIEIISKALVPPIPIEGAGYDIEEAARFKYRYLDLRRDRLQRNLKLRHKATILVREFLTNNNFVEIETPYLSKTTPEGARDFLVPSRLQKGNFYALAQSPQQYKQLLMIAGFERYYQLARAFRDEDLRADRQFEHTQIDLEMAFVNREAVMSLIEELVTKVVEGVGKKIDHQPFPILSHREAIKKYKTDRPNLNKENEALAFAWVVDFPLFEKTDQGGYTFSHNPFAAPKPEHVDDLLKQENLDNLQSLQYDLVCNGEEVGGGSIRISDPKIQYQVFKVMGYSDEEINKQFGHLIGAYKFGAPTHGGIALGFDRLTALLAGEDNIREVIAFPVTSSGQTSVMDAPSPADQESLAQLGIKVVPEIDRSKEKKD